jgi:hypothetical protein
MQSGSARRILVTLGKDFSHSFEMTAAVGIAIALYIDELLKFINFGKSRVLSYRAQGKIL